MALRRIWVEPENISEAQVVLTGEAYRHAITVTRLQIGEKFEVVNGRNLSWTVQLQEIGKKQARAAVLSTKNLPDLKRPHIHLALAIPKWPTFEFIVEKAVELGVYSIQPLFSEFSHIRNKKDYPEHKQERLLRIIQGATEQCGRGGLLVIRPPTEMLSFAKTLNQNDAVVGLFAYEGPTALDIQSALTQKPFSQAQDIWIFIGSEGGFSDSEVREMGIMGMPPVTLGEQILRVDTACFSLVSVIKYQLGLLKR